MSTPLPKPKGVLAWTEPESAANSDYQPVYPYNTITQTKGGHSFEMDDTPTRKVEQIDGSVEQFIKGDFTQTVQGTHTVSSFGNMKINAGSSVSLVPGLESKLTINSNFVKINADVDIATGLVANKITSRGRIDSGPLSGISAGVMGFYSLTGGVSIGLPTPAIPATIMCSGPITSFSSVSAPLGTYGISSSLLGFDVINTLLRKVHTHVAKGGPTSPPLNQEVTI